MKQRFLSLLTALGLSLSLLNIPVAQALTVEQAAQLLEEYYVDEVPQSVLEQPTIEDMLEALGDRYTEYLTAEQFSAFNATMSDSRLVGIGVVSVQTEEGLLLDSVLAGSPAEKGGMEPGDIIVSVDGHSIIGEDSDTAISRILGEEGTPVKITYLRNGQKKTVTLKRAVIVIPATTTELIDDHIGYIRCTTFGEETAGHFREGLEAYKDQATVWIVDLRSNTGGITQAAVDAAGYFTGPGLQAYLRNSMDEYRGYYSEEEILSVYPVIVLVDEGSASSSELFAAAIRDNQAGIVIGTRTFGKGVAQTILTQREFPEFFSEGDAFKITSDRFFSPAGSSTDQVGIIPDILVEPEYIDAVAYLLAGPAPTTDTSGLLRIDLGWRWFVDPELAGEYPDVFQVLLDRLPVSAQLWLGTGGSTGWKAIEPEEAAGLCAVEYHPPVFPDQEISQFPVPVSLLKTYGLLHGKEDGLFHPKDTLTRAELCQLLAVALNCMVPDNASPYSDVPDNAWYAPAVIAMSNMGLVNGTGKGEFHPEETVDHQQFITIMGRLGQRFSLYLYDDMQNTPKENKLVAGVLEYADWAQPYVWLLSYSQKGYFGNTLSLLWDTGENIDPTAATIRDEAAYTLYRLLSYTRILSV